MKDEENIPENEDLPDFLKELKGKNPYAVPENYFEELPGMVMKKITEKERPKKGIRHFFSRPLYPASLAAAMIALVMTFYFVIKPGEKKTKYVAEQKQEFNGIEDYLFNTANVDEEQILDATLDEQDSGIDINMINPVDKSSDSMQAKKEQKIPIPADTSITKEDILQYLIDEDFDPENDF